jgi:hypothetical protein
MLENGMEVGWSRTDRTVASFYVLASSIKGVYSPDAYAKG